MDEELEFSKVGKGGFTCSGDSAGDSTPEPRGRLLSFPPPARLPSPVEAYLARLAPSSGRTMRKLLSRMATIISPELNVATVRWHLLGYSDTLQIRCRLVEIYAPATCRLALCALRGVLKEAWRLGLSSREEYERAVDVPAVRGSHKRLRPEIDPHRIQQLFSAVSEDSSARAVRDRAILGVLYGGGLRRAELAALSLEDYQDHALKVCGKGRQYRQVYLPREAAEFVTRWVEIRGQKPGSLFVRIHRCGRVTQKPLSTEAIARIVRRRAVVVRNSPSAAAF